MNCVCSTATNARVWAPSPLELWVCAKCNKPFPKGTNTITPRTGNRYFFYSISRGVMPWLLSHTMAISMSYIMYLSDSGTLSNSINQSLAMHSPLGVYYFYSCLIVWFLTVATVVVMHCITDVKINSKMFSGIASMLPYEETYLKRRAEMPVTGCEEKVARLAERVSVQKETLVLGGMVLSCIVILLVCAPVLSIGGGVLVTGVWLWIRYAQANWYAEEIGDTTLPAVPATTEGTQLYTVS
jgi:hypothetical protein